MIPYNIIESKIGKAKTKNKNNVNTVNNVVGNPDVTHSEL
jgi:hypothetical protein